MPPEVSLKNLVMSSTVSVPGAAIGDGSAELAKSIAEGGGSGEELAPAGSV